MSADSPYHGRGFGISLGAILSLMLIALVGAGIVFYDSYDSYYTVQVERQLQSVAHLKQDRLTEIRSDLIKTAKNMIDVSLFSTLVERFVLKGDLDAERDLVQWMTSVKTSNNFDAVMLLDSGYNKRICISDRKERPVSEVSPTSAAGLAAGRIVFEDFYYNDFAKAIFLKLLAPIPNPNNKDEVIAILAFRIDPESTIFPFLSEWPTESRSAETLLVRRDGEDALYLNSLRFQKDSALRLRMPLSKTEIPAIRAVLGERGILEGVDYRGVHTVAAAAEVPDSPWILVARMDRDEIRERLDRDRLLVFGFIGALGLVVAFGVYWTWSRRRALFERALDLGREEQARKDQQFGTLFENVGVGVAVIDRSMRVMQANRVMREWFGNGTPGSDRTCHASLCSGSSDEPCEGCPVLATFSDGRRHEGDMSRQVGGVTKHYRVVTTPFTVVDGAVISAIEVVDDVTQRRRIEKTLADRESVMAAITDSAQDAIVMMDPKGEISFWNPAAERMFGFARRQALGKRLHDMLAPQRFHSAHNAAFPEFLRSGTGGAIGKTLELPALTAGGVEMIVSLSLSAVKISDQWHAVGILRDVTEEKKAQQELHNAVEQLALANSKLAESNQEANRMAVEAQAANIAKSQFLANMSHEIRTPMNGVIGMTALLLDTPLTSEQRRFAEVVRSSGEALLDVINDILDFSKIEADKLALETIDFDLRNTVEDAVELLAFRAHEKEIEFICRVDPEVPTMLRGDPGRLRQVLVNLGGNAIKFTASGEVVLDVSLVSETDAGATIRCEVRDTGIGIPADKIGLLFRAFQQVDASTTRRFGGTGLGLAICKRIVDAMGGDIGVESQEGKGSKFWFTLTLERQPHVSTPIPGRFGDIRGARILAVDDNPTNRLVIGEQLNSWQADHVEVRSAREALDALRLAHDNGHPFQVLITDMQMPDMDGEALGIAVKSDPQLRDTVMVVITSVGRRGDAKRMKSIGFAAYLTKPVKQSQLYDCLARLLGQDAFLNLDQAPLITRHSLVDARRRETRVLLAEDHPTNQLVALRLLGKLGYTAEAVANGQEAIQALCSRPFDLVLMDVQMPVMDGFEATRLIRSGAAGVENPRIPIIAITAHALKGDRERCLDNGMDDYITKPIDPEALVSTLERWMAKTRNQAVRVAETKDTTVRVTAPSDAAPAHKIFDRPALLSRLMDDEDLVREIAAGFLADMPIQLEHLRKHVDAAETAVAGDVAHGIKGAAANVGGMAFSAVAFQIEKAGRAGHLAEVAALVPELEAQFTLLQTAMLEGMK